MKVDVHGSCVSYNMIKKDDGIGFQHTVDGIESNLFYSHVNIAGSVLPALSIIPSEEDFEEWASSHLIRNIITDISKTVLYQLQHSKAEWLLIDFYDFAGTQWICENSCYTHVARLEIIAPGYYEKIKEKIEGNFSWMEIPTFLWYPLVDQYFEQIIHKYKDHIILNRVHLNQFYITEDGQMEKIPDSQVYLGSYADNEKIRSLEDYVISRYNVKVIDISRFFFADYAFAHDVLAVHYEEEYYLRGGRILKKILNGEDVQTDMLDIDSLRYKVKKSNLLLPEFRNMYFGKCTWHCDKLWDDLLVALSPEEQEQNKWAILRTYEWIADQSDFMHGSDLKDYEKQKIMIDKFHEFSIKSNI